MRRGKYWQPPMIAYTTGTALELVPERYSHGNHGFRSRVCWGVGEWRFRTDILIDKYVDGQGFGDLNPTVKICVLEFLTPAGWKELIVRPPKTISGPIPEPKSEEIEEFVLELEKALIQDAMRVLEGFDV